MRGKPIAAVAAMAVLAAAGAQQAGAAELDLEKTSNEPATIAFRQAIGADEGLRTGTYSKTLTFTLSTTDP